MEHIWGQDYAEFFPWSSIRDANQTETSASEKEDTREGNQQKDRKPKSYEDSDDERRRFSEENKLVPEAKHHLSNLNQFGPSMNK